MRYAPRLYRDLAGTARWTSFQVKVETSDLYLRAQGDFSHMVRSRVVELRGVLRAHIDAQPEFLSSLEPVKRLPGAHPLIEEMYCASEAAGVGPMAAVAGAVAEAVGRGLCSLSGEVIVENGGDIWLKAEKPVILSVLGGAFRISQKAGIRIAPERTPCGVCTSSGSIGHSLSLGRADAATVIAGNAALADAVATGTGNLVQDENDLEKAASYAMGIPGVRAVLVLYRDRIIVQGDIELAEL